MRGAGRVGGLALLVVSISAVYPLSSRAQKAEPVAVPGDAQLVSVLKKGTGAPILVGASGQLYHPSADRTWQRQHVGGVSTRVEKVIRSAQGGIFAIGTRTPLFELDTDRWSSYALAKRGKIRSSGGELGIFSVGRTIYQLDAKGFGRIGTARGNVEAIWASTGSRLFVLTNEQSLWTGTGNSWRPIAVDLDKDESIVNLAGVPGQAAVARSSHNRLFHLDGKKARLVTMSSDLAGLQIHVIAAAFGKLYVAGVRNVDSKPSSVLAELTKDGLHTVANLWPLAQNDRFAIITSNGPDQLLVASRAGQLRIRDKQGTWLPGLVDLTPPKGPAARAERAPALAR